MFGTVLNGVFPMLGANKVAVRILRWRRRSLSTCAKGRPRAMRSRLRRKIILTPFLGFSWSFLGLSAACAICDGGAMPPALIA